jgi:hypothetical protein
MMSPERSPPFSAGLPSMTSATRTPLSSRAPKLFDSSAVIGCTLTPSQPRATFPRVVSSA